jgi:hypothetical protein
MINRSIDRLLIGSVFCCASALNAMAASDADQAGRDEVQATSAAARQKIRGLGAALNESTLAEMRGGAEVLVNQQDLSARLSSVSASNLTTGANTITEGSFANANGLPIVIQNSGNGVIIQNSTILNLNVR